VRDGIKESTSPCRQLSQIADHRYISR